MKLKKIGFPIIAFLLTHALGVGIYQLLIPYSSKEEIRVVVKCFYAVSYVILTVKYVGLSHPLFQIKSFSKHFPPLALLLTGLFALNNYFLANYSADTGFMANSSFALVSTGFILNSFYEEFAYRGFIQSSINKNIKIISPISRGNLIASGLMVLTHLGFFWVMETLFAITSLCLVLIFSLIIGYLRDKGNSIWLLVGLHTLVNTVHVLVNLEHYIVLN